MADGEPRVTEAEVVALNRETLARTARWGRYGGNVLIVVGLVGVAGWLWMVARQQQLFGSADPTGGIFAFSEEVSPLQRVDLFSTSLGYLLNAVLTGGLGLGLRLVAEHLTIRSGGSLTPLRAGERWSDAVDDDEL